MADKTFDPSDCLVTPLWLYADTGSLSELHTLKTDDFDRDLYELKPKNW